MKPLTLKARGYRSFADLEYRFVDGATAVVGENGAGKSSLIGAVDLALFGPRSRSLEPYVREGCDDLMVELEFEHGGDVYRVRRGWRNGKTTLDLERWQEHPEHSGDDTGPEWRPLTQGSAADTQQLLERIIGMTRATFQASGYLAQRQSDTFTGAQPRDRKRLLADALGLDAWDASREAVAADRKTVEGLLAAAVARVEQLSERVANLGALTDEAGTLRLLVDIETAAAAEKRTAAETLAGQADSLDQAETAWKVASSAAEAARARNDAHLGKLERTRAAKEQRADAVAALEALGLPEDMDSLEQQEINIVAQQALYDRALAEFDTATLRRDTYASAAQTARDQAQTLAVKAAAVIEAVGEQHCETCGQTLGVEAAHTAAASYRAQSAEHAEKAKLLADEMAAIVVPSLPAPVDRDALAEVREALRLARNSATRRAQLDATIAAVDATIAETDNDAYRDEARRLSFELAEAEQKLAAISQPEPGAAVHARARATQAAAEAAAHDQRARQASERLAAVGALLEQARQALVDRGVAAGEADQLRSDLDLLVKLEQAFGRDGIPAWIVEAQAIPHIEAEANRVLSRLGGAISRVELRTERETKAGEKRDALDIVCVTGDGDRPLETFSGGEQARAEIALALGLVDVLAARRDADLRFLALDEPAGLDQQGTEALAQILRERADGRVVLLASHDQMLRDQFDQAVVVSRGPSGSQVTT